MLFDKSLRRNVDPFKRWMDTEIWSIFEQEQMRKPIEDVFGSLDTLV